MSSVKTGTALSDSPKQDQGMHCGRLPPYSGTGKGNYGGVSLLLQSRGSGSSSCSTMWSSKDLSQSNVDTK